MILPALDGGPNHPPDGEVITSAIPVITMPIPVITMPIWVITMRRSWGSRCGDPGDHDAAKRARTMPAWVDRLDLPRRSSFSWLRSRALRTPTLASTLLEGLCTDVPMDHCGNQHGIRITLGPEWQRCEIRWSDLAQDPDWYEPTYVRAPVDPTRVLGLGFAFPATDAELLLDDVERLVR